MSMKSWSNQFQVHTQKASINLSSTPDFQYSYTTTGSSIGMVSMVTSDTNKMVWYVSVKGTQDVVSIVHLNLYTRQGW